MRLSISTGPVRASGYADKLRRVLIAATRKRGVKTEDAVKVAAHMNQHLFKILRENNVDKSDVVRIMFNIDIVDGTIHVDWASVKIEVYKQEKEVGAADIESKVPEEMPEVTDEEVRRAVEEAGRPEEEELIVEHKKPEEKKLGIIDKIKSAFRRLFGKK